MQSSQKSVVIFINALTSPDHMVIHCIWVEQNRCYSLATSLFNFDLNILREPWGGTLTMQGLFSKTIASTTLGLTLLGATALGANAQSYTIDFNTQYDINGNPTNPLNADDFADIDTQWSNIGLTLDGARKNGTGSRDLKLFNTNCQGNGCSGNDSDLGFSNNNFGNALIIQETDGNWNEANDRRGGGSILFDFDFDVSFDSVTLLDVEESSGAFLTAFDKAGNELWATTRLITGGNKSFQTYNLSDFGFDDTNVRSLTLQLSGSGAIGDVSYTKTNEAVPEPFSMIGAGLALGAGAFFKNRKK